MADLPHRLDESRLDELRLGRLRLDDVPGAAEAVLVEFFAARGPILESVSPVFADAAGAVRTFVLRGGKRARPMFAWAGWLCAGDSATDPATALRVCAALELVQACALIHDDILDRSDTRRGFPTVHREFEHQHRLHEWSGDSAHFGESAAVLLGDLALVWADDMMRESGIDAATAGRIAPVWAAMRTEVLGGQYLDIVNEAAGDESAAAAYRVMRFKTAAYTVERPLQLGAELAGADPELVALLRKFGSDIGVAFQLRDDLLGVFGDAAVTGKPSGDDLISGKRTALLAAALARADADNPDAAATLRGRIGKPLTGTEIDETRDLIRTVGAVDEIEGTIDDLLTSARDCMAAADAPEAAKAQLAALATRMTKRHT